MSNTKITDAGLALFAAKQAASQTLAIDKMVFANISGLDVTQTPPGTEAMPAPGDIQLQADITKAGTAGADTVVYSTVLSSVVGTWSFNWIGLYSSADDVLVAVAYVPLQEKRATSGAILGNSLTKNFGLQYTDVTNLTGITIDASTWQIDLKTRLEQIDERERLSNFDIYGQGYFLDAGFQLFKDGAAYKVKAGAGYVGGLRVNNAADQDIGAVGTLPTDIYVDAVLSGDHSGKLVNWNAQASQATLNDYSDNDGQHYLVKIGSIDASGNVITDLRSFGELHSVPALAQALEDAGGGIMPKTIKPGITGDYTVTQADIDNGEAINCAASTDITVTIECALLVTNGKLKKVNFCFSEMTADKRVKIVVSNTGTMKIDGWRTDLFRWLGDPVLSLMGKDATNCSIIAGG